MSPSTVSPLGIEGRAVGVGELATRAVELATDMGAYQVDPIRDVETLVEPEVAAGQELPCMNGWHMRSAEAHRYCRCLVEVDRAGEGTIQEGERAPQRGGLEVELTCDAGSLHAHTPDGDGGGLAISDE